MLQTLRMDHGPLSYENDPPPPLHLLATGLTAGWNVNGIRELSGQGTPNN